MKVKEKYWDHWEKKWIVRVYDKPVLEDDGVPEHGTKFRVRTWWFRPRQAELYAHYRFDPVPGIHNKKGRFACWYKKTKTMQERRRYYADGNDYVRGSRRDHNLPNAYDDYPRSDRFIKHSWKKVKKEKQWM